MNATTATFRVEPRGDREIVITRSFAAPRALVFDAWTTPELVRRWLGPRSWTMSECEIDLRVGGSYRYVSHGPDGASMTFGGSYRELDPPSRIVSTESFDDDWTGGETVNTIEFTEVDGVTTVVNTVLFASAESRGAALGTGMEHGVREGYERLDAVLDGTAPSPVAERFRRRADIFEATIDGVPADAWSNRSPCAEWDARGVVQHVVEMLHVMLQPAGRTPTPAPSTADDPLAAYRAARADVDAVLADRAVAESECDTPMGRVTVERHVDQVVSADLVLHRWDLARATGQDDAFDPAEADTLWAMATGIPDIMRVPEAFGPGIVVFGPVVPVPDDAPRHDRIIGLLGRDPAFRP